MAQASKITPIDRQLTKLPLPVLMKGEDFTSSKENFHHHFHPERSQHLGFDPTTNRKYPKSDSRQLEGRAVRWCRGQAIPEWLHGRYNKLFCGPLLPQTTSDKFATVVLCCAGIVPRQAINLYTPDEYVIEEDLTDEQYEFIRRRVFFEGADSPFKRAKRAKIGSFLADYTVNHALPGVVTETEVKNKVKEFLRPRDEAQRWQAGHFILTHAIDVAVDDIRPIHELAKEDGLVPNQRRSLGEVVVRFFTPDRFVDYFEPIEDLARAALA